MNLFTLGTLALALTTGVAWGQGQAKVWDEKRDEWVSISEYTRRYSNLGIGALRLSQVGPVEPAFTADLRVIPDPPQRRPVDRFITIPPGPKLIRGRVYDSPHTR